MNELKEDNADERPNLRSWLMDWSTFCFDSSKEFYCCSESSSNEEKVGKEEVEMSVLETERAFAEIAKVLRDDLDDDEYRFEKRILENR